MSKYVLDILFKYRNCTRQSTRSIRKNVSLVFKNHLAANAGKYYLLTSPKTSVDIHISNTEIFNEEKVKVLSVNLEGRLNFDFQVNTLL